MQSEWALRPFLSALQLPHLGRRAMQSEWALRHQDVRIRGLVVVGELCSPSGHCDSM